MTITGAGAQAIFMQGGNNGNQAIHIELNRIFANGLGNNCSGAIEINDGNPDVGSQGKMPEPGNSKLRTTPAFIR